MQSLFLPFLHPIFLLRTLLTHCIGRLWGNPSHLSNLAKSLQEGHAELHVLVAKSNANTYTYDGIELGGERIANEIERRIEELETSGINIKKLSVIGYSLGGLVARYAVGLLYSNDLFEKIQPMVRVLSEQCTLLRRLPVCRTSPLSHLHI